MYEEKSIFEQMGGTYTEIDGALYPNLITGNEEKEAASNIFSGKYGDLWKRYLKENQSDKYYYLLRTGKLQQRAAEIDEEANEMLDRIIQQYLKRNRPEKTDSTMEMWQIREQAKMMAEEVVFREIIYI